MSDSLGGYHYSGGKSIGELQKVLLMNLQNLKEENSKKDLKGAIEKFVKLPIFQEAPEEKVSFLRRRLCTAIDALKKTEMILQKQTDDYEALECFYTELLEKDEDFPPNEKQLYLDSILDIIAGIEVNLAALCKRQKEVHQKIKDYKLYLLLIAP